MSAQIKFTFIIAWYCCAAEFELLTVHWFRFRSPELRFKRFTCVAASSPPKHHMRHCRCHGSAPGSACDASGKTTRGKTQPETQRSKRRHKRQAVGWRKQQAVAKRSIVAPLDVCTPTYNGMMI